MKSLAAAFLRRKSMSTSVSNKRGPRLAAAILVHFLSLNARQSLIPILSQFADVFAAVFGQVCPVSPDAKGRINPSLKFVQRSRPRTGRFHLTPQLFK